MVFEQIPMFIGQMYGIAAVILIAFLWYHRVWTQKIRILFLIIAVLLGFLIFSPVPPYQFEHLVLQIIQNPGPALIAGIVGITISIILVFIFGRFFCGYVCPVGCLQEIVYYTPVKKINIHQKKNFMIIRAVFFILFVILALTLSVSIFSLFGIKDFYYIIPTAGAVIFLILILISNKFYRPFCRLVCPVGLIFSLVSWKSIFKIRKTDACIDCKKCEKVCPVDEAGNNDLKAECYLCGRCMDVCPVEGAIYYGREYKQKK